MAAGNTAHVQSWRQVLRLMCSRGLRYCGSCAVMASGIAARVQSWPQVLRLACSNDSRFLMFAKSFRSEGCNRWYSRAGIASVPGLVSLVFQRWYRWYSRAGIAGIPGLVSLIETFAYFEKPLRNFRDLFSDSYLPKIINGIRVLFPLKCS